MDWGSTMVVDAGCVQEDLVLSSCLAESTADGYECVSGSPAWKVDVCVPETAASNLCWDRESRMFDMAKKICALQADLPCAAAATPCANAIHAESSQYGNIGCGALRERLLLCLGDLTQYDFECSQAGGILAPAVKGGWQGPCGAAQTDLSNCVCSSGAGGSGGLGGSGGAAGSTPLTGGAGGEAAGAGGSGGAAGSTPLTGGAGGGAAGAGPCATMTCNGPFRCCPYIFQDTTGPVCVGNCFPNSQACPTPAC
jgi:hypothetical protein